MKANGMLGEQLFILGHSALIGCLGRVWLKGAGLKGPWGGEKGLIMLLDGDVDAGGQSPLEASASKGDWPLGGDLQPPPLVPSFVWLQRQTGKGQGGDTGSR